VTGIPSVPKPDRQHEFVEAGFDTCRLCGDGRSGPDHRYDAPKPETQAERLRRDMHDAIHAARYVAPAQTGEKSDAIWTMIHEQVEILADALAAAESRIVNEQAARRLAQEHGIGDRARIQELEDALAENGPADNGMNFCGYCGKRIKEVKYRERD